MNLTIIVTAISRIVCIG